MAAGKRRWKVLIVAAVAGIATVPAARSYLPIADGSSSPLVAFNPQLPGSGTGSTTSPGAPLDPRVAGRGSLAPAATTLGVQQQASTSPVGSDAPVPVLVIPGWSDDETRLAAMGARLTAAGWESRRVLTLSFEDPVGSNRDHAREIAQAVLDFKTRTGADRVDIVAHSMGGLATRYFLLNGGDAHIRRVVFLATPHMGTVSALFAWGEGAREMEPRSSFLLGMLRAQPIPSGVRAITIRTPLDLHVVPNESATLPGIPDLKVCCPTHAGLLDDDQTFELIQRFLRDPR
jgi:triacylglycerol lipase